MILSAIFFKKEIFSPLFNLKTHISELISGDKDLTKRLNANKTDEFTEAAVEVNKFIDMIQTTVNDVKTLGRKNTHIASKIWDSNQLISQGVQKEQQIVSTTTNKTKFIQELLEKSIAITIETQKNVNDANHELESAETIALKSEQRR